eukprot:15452716-Alexandrium_andersonii.AAC.1
MTTARRILPNTSQATPAPAYSTFRQATTALRAFRSTADPPLEAIEKLTLVTLDLLPECPVVERT